MPRNIELKARLTDPSHARAVAERVATNRITTEWQRDTYFRVAAGRLKLREIERDSVRSVELIAYSRTDDPGARASDYHRFALEPITAGALREMLAGTCGVLVTVDKRREIFLRDNVRIHLDEVSGLGAFIEFEAVLGPDVDDESGRAQLAWLRTEFALPDSALQAQSYSDLLLD